jgi:hypothetical protein
MATLTRKANMNRLYITGKTEPIRRLLSDFHARSDSSGYWVPLYQETRFRAALKDEAEHEAKRAADLEAWHTAKSVIPVDYKTRHGAMLGGDVVIDGERISEPALDTRNLPWVSIARHETRVRDLTGQSLINGRVKDSETLYAATVADGRAIYRIAHYGSFGDDLRETYYLPPDLWERMMLMEVRLRKITPEVAEEWLAKYRGCVGHELYEFAATFAVRSGECNALPSPRKQSLSGGTEGR